MRSLSLLLLLLGVPVTEKVWCPLFGSSMLRHRLVMRCRCLLCVGCSISCTMLLVSCLWIMIPVVIRCCGTLVIDVILCVVSMRLAVVMVRYSSIRWRVCLLLERLSGGRLGQLIWLLMRAVP